MIKPVLTLAVLIALTGSAIAGGRQGDRYSAPPPPSPSGRYYGPVNNYYAPVTIYAAPDGGGYAAYPSTAYPAYSPNYSPNYSSDYSPGYATAPACDANCYGAGYDWSHGADYGGYGGYAYPTTGYGYGYPPSNQGSRMDPWAGYNWGPNNGYW